MTADYTQTSPLDLAQDDLARIDETIATLQAERAKVVAFVEMYGKYAKLPPISSVVQEAPRTTGRGALTILKAPLNVRIGNFLAHQLASVERPLPINTIFEMLAPNDLIPGGKDPKQAVSAILGKDKRFKYSVGQGWSLVRQPTFQELGGQYKAP